MKKNLPASPHKIPRVAVMVESTHAFDRGLLEGVGKYMRRHQPWNIYRPQPFYLTKERGRRRLENLKRWQPDGLILREQVEDNEAYLNLGIPTIFCAWRDDSPQDVRQMREDPEEVGRLAADYFRERGYHYHAFCGYDEHFWSSMRRDAFVRRVEALGGRCTVYADPFEHKRHLPRRGIAELAEWLRQLPEPCALLTATDERSLQVVEAAALAAIPIPEEIAVLGVNNDPLICSLSRIPLSSIKLNEIDLGYRAAAELDAMLDGKRSDKAELRIRPLGVATRLSTDTIATDDAKVAMAISFIHQNHARLIGVDDVAAAAGLSRRGLEYRFKKALGSPIYEMIQRVRLKKATELLAETDLPITEVAARVGFSELKHFSRSFQKRFGTNARAWREQAGSHASRHPPESL